MPLWLLLEADDMREEAGALRCAARCGVTALQSVPCRAMPCHAGLAAHCAVCPSLYICLHLLAWE